MLNFCLGLHLLVGKNKQWKSLDFTTHKKASQTVPANQFHIYSLLLLSIITFSCCISSGSHLSKNKGVFPTRMFLGTCWERSTGRFSVQKATHCKDEKEQSNSKD